MEFPSFDQIVDFFGALILTVFLGFIAFCICIFIWKGMITASDGRYDYCYVVQDDFTHDKRGFVLEGHVPWSRDRVIGTFDRLDDAVLAAQKISCPLHVE